MTDDHVTGPLLRQAGDLAAVGVTIASIASWLPSIATLLSIIWFALRIWESDTVREWTGRVKPR